MSTEAFGARRVTDSLRAVAGYLDEAVKSASRIPAGAVTRLDVEPIPRDLGPRLKKVTRKTAYSRILVVEGSDLADVDEFKLVEHENELVAVRLISQTNTGFEAEFGADVPRSRYDAMVIDRTGQAFVLRDALVESVAGTGNTMALALTAQVFPNPIQMNALVRKGNAVGVALLVRGAQATDVEDPHVERGSKRTNWDVTVVNGQQLARWKPHGFQSAPKFPDELVRLYMVIPKRASVGQYYLVAKHKATGTDIRVAFYIR